MKPTTIVPMMLIMTRLRERHGEEIGADRGRGLEVLLVLCGERGRGQAAALAVDPLVVGQPAADDDARDDARSVDGLDL